MATRTVKREAIKGGDILILAPQRPEDDEIRVPVKGIEVEGPAVYVYSTSGERHCLYREGLAKVERGPGR